MAWKRKPVLPEHKSSIEITTHKDATKEVVEQAKQANKNLKEMLEENHFTLTIVLALTGKKGKPR